MCPYFNELKQECRVVPYDSSAKRDTSWIRTYCSNSNGCKKCGNYESAQRGEYKIRR